MTSGSRVVPGALFLYSDSPRFGTPQEGLILFALFNDLSPQRRRVALITATGALVAAALGWSASRPDVSFGLVAAAAATIFLVLTGATWLALLAAPSAYIVIRLSLPGGLYPSDALVLMASIVPIVTIDWRKNRGLVRCLVGLAIFDCLLVLSVLNNFSISGALEVAHRTAIVGGGLLVGSFLVYRGKTVQAMWTFVAASFVLGLASLATFASNGFTPAYPFGIQKNYVGSLLSSALLMSILLNPKSRSLRIVLWGARLMMTGGLLATESRGALLGLAIGGLIWAVLSRKSRSLVMLLLFALVPIIAVSIQAELSVNSAFTPTATRLRFAQQAMDTWLGSPLLGNGLRFFLAGSTALAGDPHDIVLLTLAESGILGLLGLTVLLGRTLVVLVKIDSPIAKIAIAMMVARLAHGLVDVYWVHGSQEIPWIVVGMALASSTLAVRTRTPSGETWSPASPGGPATPAPHLRGTPARSGLPSP